MIIIIVYHYYRHGVKYTLPSRAVLAAIAIELLQLRCCGCCNGAVAAVAIALLQLLQVKQLWQLTFLLVCWQAQLGLQRVCIEWVLSCKPSSKQVFLRKLLKLRRANVTSLLANKALPLTMKASRNNPHPTFSNCKQSDVRSARFCLMTFRKKNNCILL